MSAIDEFARHNDDFAEGFDLQNLRAAPAKRIAVITCMDARLDPAAALGIAAGDAHVIRNAGGAVSDDAIRSVMISQRLLGTTEVMIVQHTDCGMMTFTDDEMKEAVTTETGVQPTFPIEAFDDLEENVRDSIQRVKDSPFIPHRENVRGFVYDVATGRVEEVD